MTLDEVLKDYSVIPYTGSYPERMLGWAEELESGKYSQVQRRLKEGNIGRCCLGVACDYSSVGQWQGDTYVSNEQHDSVCLPSSVAEYLGLSEGEDPWILTSESDLNMSFAGCNDSLGLSFKEIAFLIRESVRLGKDG